MTGGAVQTGGPAAAASGRPLRVLISCGEPSGDLYAADLTRALKARVPGIDVRGMGGPKLREAGAHLVAEYAGISVTGLTEAVSVVPRALSLVRKLTADATANRPDVFVAVDFPDFNFRLMKAIKALGIPIVYYISPQLWAWRASRMKTMQALVDRILVIFPFEERLYANAGVDARFVGHPMVETARPTATREAFLSSLGLHPTWPTFALLPGSRHTELKRTVPVLSKAMPLIWRELARAQFVVAAAPGIEDEAFAPFECGGTGRPVLVRGRTDDVIAASDVVITASGTATTQAALHEKPMVVVYKLSAATYAMAKPFALVDMYAMPNLIAGRRIVPELIQGDFTPRRVAEEAVRYFTTPGLRQKVSADLAHVRSKLGEPGASARAADAVVDVALRARASR
ncbi:MAG: lipid-A-disaccharide synthase [Vicinamibacterales bacterium]